MTRRSGLHATKQRLKMSQEIYIDVNYLTESERDIVLQVLARDEELRRQEKRRIRFVIFHRKEESFTRKCLEFTR